nr:MAG TPA: hypothetical protein [Caudoviricetes sp.]
MTLQNVSIIGRISLVGICTRHSMRSLLPNVLYPT